MLLLERQLVNRSWIPHKKIAPCIGGVTVSSIVNRIVIREKLIFYTQTREPRKHRENTFFAHENSRKFLGGMRVTSMHSVCCIVKYQDFFLNCMSLFILYFPPI